MRTSEKFKNILKMFAQCHKVYDASFLSDDSIEKLSKFKCTHLKFNTNFIHMHYCYLGQAITNFMDAFRKSFPKATVPVKMHMLEHRLKTLRNGIGNAIHCNGIDTVSRKYDVMYILRVFITWCHGVR